MQPEILAARREGRRLWPPPLDRYSCQEICCFPSSSTPVCSSTFCQLQCRFDWVHQEQLWSFRANRFLQFHSQIKIIPSGLDALRCSLCYRYSLHIIWSQVDASWLYCVCSWVHTVRVHIRQQDESATGNFRGKRFVQGHGIPHYIADYFPVFFWPLYHYS